MPVGSGDLLGHKNVISQNLSANKPVLFSPRMTRPNGVSREKTNAQNRKSAPQTEPIKPATKPNRQTHRNAS
jgi:hypothetical protein